MPRNYYLAYNSLGAIVNSEYSIISLLIEGKYLTASALIQFEALFKDKYVALYNPVFLNVSKTNDYSVLMI